MELHNRAGSKMLFQRYMTLVWKFESLKILLIIHTCKNMLLYWPDISILTAEYFQLKVQF